MPTASERAELTDCDAAALYYGIGVPVDFERARRCAFVDAERAGGAVIGGAEISMMVYANGRGVPADLDLAIHFACAVGGAPAELEARVRTLWRAKRAGKLEAAFDVCDHVTSGAMAGHCAAQQERLAAVERAARKQKLAAHLPAAPLTRLEAAAAAYFRTRADREVDLSGTLRAALSIAERARLEDTFVTALERLSDPTFPEESGDPAELERELAALIARVPRCRDLAELEEVVPGTITRAGILETQRRWRAYRDAFVALALAVRPAGERGRFVAWLTQARLGELGAPTSGC